MDRGDVCEDHPHVVLVTLEGEAGSTHWVHCVDLVATLVGGRPLEEKASGFNECRSLIKSQASPW